MPPVPQPGELKFGPADKDGKLLLLPPGPFTDGCHYDLAELKGKVIVLLWFDPTIRHSVQQTTQRVAELAAFADRPVIILGIARGDANAAQAAFRQTKGYVPPMGFDPAAVLSHLWMINGRGESFCVFDPKGNVSGWSSMASCSDTVLKACENATWKYKDDKYNKALNAAIDLLEWNHYPEGMKLLRPLRRDGRKGVAESAEKLYGVIKAEGDKWKADADAALADNPVKAYDLYLRLAGAFTGEDLGKAAAESVKTLSAKKPVADELAARQMLAQLSALPYDTRRTPAVASDLLKQIVDKYPGTPSAARAKLFRGVIPLAGF
jgi:hypothetical protein